MALAGKFAQYCIQFPGYRWHLQRHTMSELLTLLGNAASQFLSKKEKHLDLCVLPPKSHCCSYFLQSGLKKFLHH